MAAPVCGWRSERREHTGSLAGDLLALTRPWARQLAAKPYGRVIAALITSAQGDPRFAEIYRAGFLEPRRDVARVIFHRAIERGEIPADTDIEVALDLLYGPFYHRVLHGHAQLTDRFTRAIVDHVVTAVARPPKRPRRVRPRGPSRWCRVGAPAPAAASANPLRPGSGRC